MLQNPVYIGKVQWNQRQTVYHIEDGKRTKSRPRSDNMILVDGHHEPIIEEKLWKEVQAMFATHAKRPKNLNAVTTNPLAGLVVCACCGRHMQRKPSPNRQGDFLFCPTQHCPTCSTYIPAVENAILDGLRDWVARYQTEADAPTSAHSADASANAAARAQLTDQLHTLEAQSGKLFDLLEQGVYDVATFRARRADLDARIAAAKEALGKLDAPPPVDPIVAILPQVRTVLGAYDLAAAPADRNALLRTVIERVEYKKPQRGYRNSAPGDNLNIQLFPCVPTEND